MNSPKCDKTGINSEFKFIFLNKRQRITFILFFWLLVLKLSQIIHTESYQFLNLINNHIYWINLVNMFCSDISNWIVNCLLSWSFALFLWRKKTSYVLFTLFKTSTTIHLIINAMLIISMFFFTIVRHVIW